MRWMDFSKKEHLGSIDWKLCQDWKILQWGNIFSIPPEELKKYNWGDIGFGLTVEFPIIKSEYDYSTKGQNTKVYYTVKLDWEYLLERQANLFASLGWSKPEIENFLTEQLSWLDKRSQELDKVQKEKSLQEAALQMSQLTGQPLEYWLEKVKELDKKATIEEPEKVEEDYQKGVIQKLGNEYFIKTEDGLWKIGQTDKYRTRIGALILTDCCGFEYSFKADLKEPAPKSRNALGWVKSIVLS